MSYRRTFEEKRRLKKLYDQTRNWIPSSVYYDYKKDRYIRYYRGNKWLKVHCKRIIRRKLKDTDALYSRGQYKKFYDYWWALY